jgi:hypothetical protein
MLRRETATAQFEEPQSIVPKLGPSVNERLAAFYSSSGNMNDSEDAVRTSASKVRIEWHGVVATGLALQPALDSRRQLNEIRFRVCRMDSE